MAKDVEPKEADLMLEDDREMLEELPSEIKLDITVKDLKQLGMPALKSTLTSYELAFITMARDPEPDIKGMRNLRAMMKRVQKVILWKLEKAIDEDSNDYLTLIKLTKSGNVDKKEELIKKILGQ